MLVALGSVINGITRRRTHAPVRRNSKPAGQCEGTIWKKTNRGKVSEIVLAAKRYELAKKQPGKRTGPLGTVALEVLELLAHLVDYNTGRLEPSLDTMMRLLRRSRDAIMRGLNALRDHGFIDWMRRFVPSENAGSKGPQVRQTSNAYCLTLPEEGRKALGRYGIAPPPPEDRIQADKERADEVENYRASMTADDLLEEMEGGPTKDALARVRRNMLLKRESAKQTESGSISIYKRERTPSFGPLTRPYGGSGPR